MKNNSINSYVTTVDVLGTTFRLLTAETIEEKFAKYSTIVSTDTKHTQDEFMGEYSQHVSAPVDFEKSSYLPIPEDVKHKVRKYVEMAALQNALSRYCAKQLTW